MGNLASIESNTIAYRGAGMYGDMGTILFPTIFWQISAEFPQHIHLPTNIFDIMGPLPYGPN